MYELVFIACLIAQPAKCEEFRIPFQEPMGAAQCIWRSQMHLAQWTESHPEWVLRKWSCQLPGA